MFALFSFLTAVWFGLIVKRRDSTHRIHWLMGALVLCKALTLLAQVRSGSPLPARMASLQGRKWVLDCCTSRLQGVQMASAEHQSQ